MDFFPHLFQSAFNLLVGQFVKRDHCCTSCVCVFLTVLSCVSKSCGLFPAAFGTEVFLGHNYHETQSRQ